MIDNKFPCGSGQGGSACGKESPRETVCVETNRILDSCRDRDCFENVKVFLTDQGQEIIERTTQVRAKDVCIAWTYIGIDPVQFNRGFYSITIRFYIKLIFEACVCPGRSQEFDGIAVLEKQVVLYGGDSCVSIFRSSTDASGFCAEPEPCYKERTVPTAVVEVVDPIVLNVRVLEPSCAEPICCCSASIRCLSAISLIFASASAFAVAPAISPTPLRPVCRPRCATPGARGRIGAWWFPSVFSRWCAWCARRSTSSRRRNLSFPTRNVFRPIPEIPAKSSAPWLSPSTSLPPAPAPRGRATTTVADAARNVPAVGAEFTGGADRVLQTKATASFRMRWFWL